MSDFARTAAKSEMRLWLGFTLFVLCAALLSARLVESDSKPTEPPTVDNGALTGGEIPKKEDVSEVGEAIISVTRGIKNSVQKWEQSTTSYASLLADEVSPGILKMLDPTKTGNDKFYVKRLDSDSDRESVGEDSSGLSSGFTMDLNLEKTSTAINIMEASENTTNAISSIKAFNNISAQTSIEPLDSPRCLSRSSDWAFCSSGGTLGFSLPNFLNHTRVEDVVALIHEWAWLLKSGCHHGLEWFFCLLVTPECQHPLDQAQAFLLPCRSFCEVLLDSCWMVLQEKGLPVACHTLPEGPDLKQPCLVVNNRKGKMASLNASERHHQNCWCVLFIKLPTPLGCSVALLCLCFDRAQSPEVSPQVITHTVQFPLFIYACLLGFL